MSSWRRTQKRVTILRYVHVDGAFESEMPVGQFIERMLSAASARGIGGIEAERDTTPPLDPHAKIIPGLTLVEGPRRRVLHKKFGEGTVLRRIENGEHEKLVIVFADRERTLLASYVEFVE